MDKVPIIEIVRAYIHNHGETVADLITANDEHYRRSQIKYLLYEAIEYALSYKKEGS